MRILVTGASGLLGLNFSLQASSKHTILGAFNRRVLKSDAFETHQVNLLEADAVPRLLDETQPDWVLNCAAEADIDRCEKNPDHAKYLNATIPGIFAKETKKRGLQFTHISTDAVFDGVEGNYKEEDPTNPLSVYAQTKFEGEQAVLEANLDSTIARVNFYGWSLFGQRSLAEFFYNNLSERKLTNGFKDVYFCPLQANLLSELLLEIFDKKLAGIYHVVSSESLSKYDFGQRLARKFGFEENWIKPTSVNDSDLQAKRSQNLNLRSDKLRIALGHSLPNIQVGIDLLFDQFQNGYRERIQNIELESIGE